jgi:hypothetical protein
MPGMNPALLAALSHSIDRRGVGQLLEHGMGTCRSYSTHIGIALCYTALRR